MGIQWNFIMRALHHGKWERSQIEDFWSILKAKVYENNWEAKSLRQLKVRIKKCLKKVDQVTILKAIGCVKKRLKDIRMFDIIENRK